MKHLLLTLFTLLSFVVFGQNLSNGLVAYWKLNGNVADSSGNNFNGTIFGSPTLVTGYDNKPLSSYSFANTDDMINFGDILDSVFARNPISQFSVTGWAKSSVINPIFGGGLIFAKQAGANGPDQWSVSHFNDSTVRGIVKSSSLLDYLEWKTAYKVNPDEWFSFVLMFDGTNSDTLNRVKFFVNGESTIFSRINGVFGRTCENTNQSITIGAGHVAGSPTIANNNFFGAVDELRIYNRLLDSSEISELSTIPIATSVQNINESEFDIVLYPNPSNNGKFNILSSKTTDAIITIYSMDGKLIKSCVSCQEFELVQKGIYLVIVEVNNQIITRKIVY